MKALHTVSFLEADHIAEYLIYQLVMNSCEEYFAEQSFSMSRPAMARITKGKTRNASIRNTTPPSGWPPMN
jgi:hypothetical protein